MFKLFTVDGRNGKEFPFIVKWFSISLIMHLVLAWFSLGFYHYDEHFQILEFAGYKMGFIPASSLPWEFGSHIRSAFQPFIAYGVLRLFSMFSIDDPYMVATVLRVLSALLGWFAMVCFTAAALPFIKENRLRKWFIVLSGLLSIIIFIHVRFSSESWAGSFAFIGIAIMLILVRKGNQPFIGYFSGWLLAAGFLLGLSYLCRVQAMFLFPGLFLWLFFIADVPFRRLCIICVGMLAAVAIGFFIDRWFYGEWVNTAYQYIVKNIIEGKAAEFGTQPWWWYFKETILSGFWPVQVLMLILILVAIFRNLVNPIVWIWIPFLLAHFLVGHKELRFLFPLVNGLPFLLILGIRGITQYSTMQKRTEAQFTKVAVAVCVVFITVNMFYFIKLCLHPQNPYFYPMRYIYNAATAPADVVIHDRDLNLLINGRLKLGYYNRPGTKYIYVQDLDSVKILMAAEKKPVYFMTSGQGFETVQDCPALSPYLEPQYYQYPEFLKQVNFNNWLGRTGFWRVYKIDPKLKNS